MSGGGTPTATERFLQAVGALIIALIGAGGLYQLALYLLGQGNEAPTASISVVEPPHQATRISSEQNQKRLSVAAGQKLEFDA